ncbi:MAG: LamG-like jellyroll fold domain-containing protein, partial [Afipia sp.]
SLAGELTVYDSVQLTFTVTAPLAVEIELYRAVNGGAYALLDTIPADTTTYEDTDITVPNVYSYYFRVLLQDDTFSEDSNVVSIDSAVLETFMLIHVEGGEIYEVTGFPAVSVVGGGAVSSVQAKFGTESFHNTGTASEGTNFVRVEGDATDFVFAGEFTWEGWFYFTANPNDSYENIFANNINYPVTGFIQVARYSGANRYLMVNTSAGGISLTSGSVPLNQWVHIAVTRNASDTLTIWLDGVSLGSASRPGTMGGDIAGVSSFDVGRGHAGDNGDAAMYFEEIRVSKVCRYTSNFTPPTAPFDPFPGN